jgi:hypothetical protein
MANIADRRRADRERKAAERKARREAGLPDPGALDRVLVDALRDTVYRRRPGRVTNDVVVWTYASFEEVIRRARRELRRRGHTKEAANAAITVRFMTASVPDVPPPAQHPVEPQSESPCSVPKSAPLTPAPAEAAPSGHDQDIQQILDTLLWGTERAEA